MTDDIGIKLLTQKLSHNDIFTKWEGFTTLVSLGDIVVPYLIQIIEDGNSESLAWASATLREIGKASIHPLVRVLKNGNDKARFGAVFALGYSDYCKPLFKDAKTNSVTTQHSEVTPLGSFTNNNDVLDTVIATLKDSDIKVRRQAAESLHNMRSIKAVEALIEALTDNDKWVRYNAIRALGVIEDYRAFKPLLELIRDKDEDVCRITMSTLVAIGGEAAIEPLRLALTDDEEFVRQQAALHLQELLFPET